MYTLKQKIFIICASFVMLLAPVAVSARGLVPCGGYKDDASTIREKPCTVEDVFVLSAKLINFLVATAGFYAVVWIVYSGFGMVLAAGNEESLSKHKKGLTNAIIGFFIVIVAFTLINTVINTVFQANVNLLDPKCYINADACGNK